MFRKIGLGIASWFLRRAIKYGLKELGEANIVAKAMPRLTAKGIDRKEVADLFTDWASEARGEQG